MDGFPRLALNCVRSQGSRPSAKYVVRAGTVLFRSLAVHGCHSNVWCWKTTWLIGFSSCLPEGYKQNSLRAKPLKLLFCKVGSARTPRPLPFGAWAKNNRMAISKEKYTIELYNHLSPSGFCSCPLRPKEDVCVCVPVCPWLLWSTQICDFPMLTTLILASTSKSHFCAPSLAHRSSGLRRAEGS